MKIIEKQTSERQLKQGDVIKFLDDPDEAGNYYIVGRMTETEQFRLVSLNDGKIYGCYGWQSSFQSGEIEIVEAELIIK